MIELKLSDLSEYDELLTDDGRNVSSIFPTQKLIDVEKWENEYDSVVDATSMGGTMTKAFFRCDSRYFDKLIKEIKEGKSNYVTHIDEFAKNTDEFPLSKISVLLKRAHDHKDMIKEVIVGKIANSLNMPTAYNELVKIGSSEYVLSVDFLKSGESMKILNPNKNCLNNMLQSFNRLDNDVLYYLDVMLQEGKINKIEYEKLHNEFVENFIFRVIILRDMDFGLNNMAMIKDKNGKYKWAPNFDYEYVFESFMDKNTISKHLEQIRKRYPQVLEKAMRKFVLENKINLFQNLKQDVGIIDALKYFNMINSQIKLMTSEYNRIIEDSMCDYIPSEPKQ